MGRGILTALIDLSTGAPIHDGPGADGFLTSPGDSGSALLSSAKFKEGKNIAVGVNSAGTAGENGVGNYGLAVRLDKHEAWLKATLEAKAPGKYQLIDSTVAQTPSDDD